MMMMMEAIAHQNGAHCHCKQQQNLLLTLCHVGCIINLNPCTLCYNLAAYVMCICVSLLCCIYLTWLVRRKFHYQDDAWSVRLAMVRATYMHSPETFMSLLSKWKQNEVPLFSTLHAYLSYLYLPLVLINTGLRYKTVFLLLKRKYWLKNRLKQTTPSVLKCFVP